MSLISGAWRNEKYNYFNGNLTLDGLGNMGSVTGKNRTPSARRDTYEARGCLSPISLLG
jgi:hypothetical protein